MHAPRSLIALLVGTVAFFALWIVALKPGSGGGQTTTQGLGAYQSAINKAHQAVQVSAADNARAEGSTTPAPAASSAPAASPSATAVKTTTTTAHPARRATTAARAHHKAARATPRHPATAASRLGTVERAIKAHKVVAMLFFNPAAADDQAVKQEFGAVPVHGGKVVKLTIPLTEIANYTAVTQQVPVNFSPTLVVVAPNGQSGEIVGFTDQFEIAQRIDDALAAKK